MKKLLNKYPLGSRFMLAILLFALALLLSTIINKGTIKEYFPYTARFFYVLLLGYYIK